MPYAILSLLEALRGERLEALFLLAMAYSLRRGEALGLAWGDVDLERGTLTVHNSLQRIGGKLQLTEPKTQTSRRTLALPPFVVSALRAHRLRQLQERLRMGERWQESGLVFTSSRGTPYEPRNINRLFERIISKAGLPHARVHDLRHSCGTLLRAMGVDLKTISELLGHSSIRITADIYVNGLDSAPGAGH